MDKCADETSWGGIREFLGLETETLNPWETISGREYLDSAALVTTTLREALALPPALNPIEKCLSILYLLGHLSILRP